MPRALTRSRSRSPNPKSVERARLRSRSRSRNKSGHKSQRRSRNKSRHRSRSRSRSPSQDKLRNERSGSRQEAQRKRASLARETTSRGYAKLELPAPGRDRSAQRDGEPYRRVSSRSVEIVRNHLSSDTRRCQSAPRISRNSKPPCGSPPRHHGGPQHKLARSTDDFESRGMRQSSCLEERVYIQESRRHGVEHEHHAKQSERDFSSARWARDMPKHRQSSVSEHAEPLKARLSNMIAKEDFKGAAKLARNSGQHGFVCPQAIIMHLRREVEQRLKAEREALLGHVSAVANALAVDISSVPEHVPTRLSPEQRLRAEVLARHVARLGAQGSSMQQAVRVASGRDSRWHVFGEEYKDLLDGMVLSYRSGARPSVDESVRRQFGIGSACPKPTEHEKASPDPRATQALRRPIDLEISSIRWSHDGVNETFGSGGSILETTVKLLSGQIDPEDIPILEVVRYNRQYHLFTGNRRLVMWRLASFFERDLLRVHVKEKKLGATEFERLVMGGKHPPKLSTQRNDQNCQGRWVRIRETGEIVGEKATHNTYGLDLLCLLFEPEMVQNMSSHNFSHPLFWRPKLSEAFLQLSKCRKKKAVSHAAKLEAVRMGSESTKELAAAALKSVPEKWLLGKNGKFIRPSG